MLTITLGIAGIIIYIGLIILGTVLCIKKGYSSFFVPVVSSAIVIVTSVLLFISILIFTNPEPEAALGVFLLIPIFAILFIHFTISSLFIASFKIAIQKKSSKILILNIVLFILFIITAMYFVITYSSIEPNNHYQWTDLAIKKENPELCNKIIKFNLLISFQDTKEQRLSCKNSVANSLAQKTNDPSYCPTGDDNCYYKLARSNNNPTSCEYVSQKNKTECFNYVNAVQYYTKKYCTNETMAECTRTKESIQLFDFAYPGYIYTALIRLADKLNDEKLCEFIPKGEPTSAHNLGNEFPDLGNTADVLDVCKFMVSGVYTPNSSTP